MSHTRSANMNNITVNIYTWVRKCFLFQIIGLSNGRRISRLFCGKFLNWILFDFFFYLFSGWKRLWCPEETNEKWEWFLYRCCEMFTRTVKEKKNWNLYIVLFSFFRNDAEMYYVRALRKTSDTLQKLAGRTKG